MSAAGGSDSVNEFEDYIATAKGIQLLQQDMIERVERGEDIADGDFQKRFLILSEQWAECMKLARAGATA